MTTLRGAVTGDPGTVGKGERSIMMILSMLIKKRNFSVIGIGWMRDRMKITMLPIVSVNSTLRGRKFRWKLKSEVLYSLSMRSPLKTPPAT